ncbi:MAG: bifunctional folylpolyglutamate synthase/dihydrofolate synthase [Gemmatimonadota bacterium]|nr:bifunctional folylpolyglutamate synthase/dihydrofolate synthase [Gemmatimonadota bacterium]
MVIALTTRAAASSPYQAAIASLFARTTGGWKFGLETTRALLATIGDPHLRFPAFHVAGTNGKGSTVHTIDALLRSQGLRVGRYTSPHLVDFRERIVIGNQPINEDEIVEWTARWMPEIEKSGATFFEATTCLAFDAFARAGVDVAVIEVGLGGRLDATNVITPLVAGVTSIALDHMQYLGDTIGDIAREKAGIFKRGVPAVISDRDPHVRTLLAGYADDAGASVVRIVDDERPVYDIEIDAKGTSFTIQRGVRGQRLATPLLGEFQAYNTAVALTMLETAGPPYAAAAQDTDALATVRIPGRFERRGRFLFDVAHNPHGAAELARLLARVAPRRPISALVAVLSDKDWRAMLAELAPQVDEFILTTAPSAPADRVWSLDDALAFAVGNGWSVRAESDFARAVEMASAKRGTTLVTGSFHTVGDCMALLQIDPLAG